MGGSLVLLFHRLLLGLLEVLEGEGVPVLEGVIGLGRPLGENSICVPVTRFLCASYGFALPKECALRHEGS